MARWKKLRVRSEAEAGQCDHADKHRTVDRWVDLGNGASSVRRRTCHPSFQHAGGPPSGNDKFSLVEIRTSKLVLDKVPYNPVPWLFRRDGPLFGKRTCTTVWRPAGLPGRVQHSSHVVAA